MTLKEVKESGIKVWEYIIEHKLLSKPVDVFPELREYDSDCAACEYTNERAQESFIYAHSCRKFCPLVKIIGRCMSRYEVNAYDDWIGASEWTEEAEQAARRILKAHQDMEVEE